MQEFVGEAYGTQLADSELLDNLLRFDALVADNGKIRPEQLNWNLEKYQNLTAGFWRNQGDITAEKLLPGFQFTTWRDIRRNYQIEYFTYPVQNLSYGHVEKQDTWLLFDYTKGEACYQKLDNFN